MVTEYRQYFQQLYDRVGEAVKVPFRDVSFESWRPALNKCHDNVDYWVEHHGKSKAVHGWIFWRPDDTGRCNFMAHSVVEGNGVLFDITPIDQNTPREGLLFLVHLGIEQEFESMKTVCSGVLYPPITMDEWRESQSSADIDLG